MLVHIGFRAFLAFTKAAITHCGMLVKVIHWFFALAFKAAFQHC
jgi:hypothetical protein